MISLTFEPAPTLTIDNEVIRGINIIERLHDMIDDSDEVKQMFEQVASLYQRIQVPSLGFRLEHPSAVMPSKKIIDVGYDLTIVSVAKQLTPMTTLFETNVSLEIPVGYYVELVPRSSISKTGYMLANNVGIIDPAFLGTLKVPLIKIDQSMPDIELPARVAQLILKPYAISYAYDATVNDRIETSRGTGGFGSTG